MEQARLSRRDFLRGAGLTGAAAAGMLAFPGAGKAFADDGAADAQSTEATDSGNEYSKALGDDASLCPLRKADFPGPRSPRPPRLRPAWPRRVRLPSTPGK